MVPAKFYETLSEAITDLKKRGYVHDFNLHPEWIECPPLNLQFKPAEFHVDEVHRFEGMTNPADSSILMAIQSSTGIKGLLVDAYGMYSDSLSPEMIKCLTIDKRTSH
ncbi:MAG: phosphoribosylpyrophosphate synthetase [Cyclobacteriaceae bacterium]|nr:phosphoribosylpyrophosphate synthetase [Cyclobacteriaceae bacterium]